MIKMEFTMDKLTKKGKSTEQEDFCRTQKTIFMKVNIKIIINKDMEERYMRMESITFRNIYLHLQIKYSREQFRSKKHDC